MKTRYLKFLLTFIFLMSSITIFGQEINDFGNDEYIFPVKPGSTEWKSKTTAENLKSCQIPENILKTISTEGLVKTCLNYPFLGDFMYFDNLQIGISRVVENFNGLQELLLRKDTGKKLYKLYKTLNLEKIDNYSEKEKGRYSIKLTRIEMLLAQNEILSNLSVEEKNLIIKECLNKYYIENSSPDIYSNFSKTTLLFLLTKSFITIENCKLKNEISTNNDLKIFIDKASIYNEILINNIIQEAEAYMSSLKN